MIQELFEESRNRMKKTLAALEDNLHKIRTGRAHPSIVQHIMVDYYGSPTPITQVANVNVEDARTLSIVPWDKKMITLIEKAIMISDLGINPSTAGDTIRLPMPAMTEERRKDMVKMARHETEQARISIRNVRRDLISDLKELNKDKEISDDELKRAEDQVQKLTDDFIASLDKLLADKEKALMEV